jgi:hypothetical protein
VLVDILQKHLSNPPLIKGCRVASWAASLPEEEQQGLATLQTKAVNVADLYRDLSVVSLPFKLTAFRSHMKGYCACPKK